MRKRGERNKNKKGIPAWGIALLIAVLIVFALAFYYSGNVNYSPELQDEEGSLQGNNIPSMKDLKEIYRVWKLFGNPPPDPKIPCSVLKEAAEKYCNAAKEKCDAYNECTDVKEDIVNSSECIGFYPPNSPEKCSGFSSSSCPESVRACGYAWDSVNGKCLPDNENCPGDFFTDWYCEKNLVNACNTQGGCAFGRNEYYTNGCAAELGEIPEFICERNGQAIVCQA